jgi:hypothetical protein
LHGGPLGGSADSMRYSVFIVGYQNATILQWSTGSKRFATFSFAIHKQSSRQSGWMEANSVRRAK